MEGREEESGAGGGRQRAGGDCNTPPPAKKKKKKIIRGRCREEVKGAGSGSGGLGRLLLGVVARPHLVVMVMEVGVEEGIWRMALIVALARR